MSVLSDRLRELRGATSQAEMARQLNMKQPQWARYESGASSPSVELLATICRVHACSADWLLGIDRAPSSSVEVRESGSAESQGSSAEESGGGVSRRARSPSPAPGELPQCLRCEHRKLADRLRKMIGGG